MKKPSSSWKYWRSSMVVRLFASVLLCVFLMLLFNWLLNTFVLVSYYRSQKTHAIEQAYSSLDKLYETGGGKLTDLLEGLYTNKGISVLLWTPDGVVNSAYQSPFWEGTDADDDGRSYVVYMMQDRRTGSKFLALRGTLHNGYPVRMSIPMASIEESVSISNNFLVLSGGVTLLVSCIVVFMVAKTFTRPIRNLSEIAGNIAQLDFSGRYKGKPEGEIGRLGTSLNSMSEQLEKTVSDLKSANLRLVDDNERQQLQNKSQKAFIANSSHELKTPIALITTYAEGLRENIATDEKSRDYYCSVIEDEAEKMSEMIRKMTMLMQLEAGSEQLSIERFNVNELLRNLLEKNRILFEPKNAEIILPEAQPTYVWADAFLIETVLTNFISNALHHVSENGVVSGMVTPADEHHVRIAVRNTGKPIPEADLPKVWESFYKVDKARTRAYGGTGIGLSVVAAIMKAHHAPYSVRNVVNPDGSTEVEFSIELEAR